jgi:hypothetical protein
VFPESGGKTDREQQIAEVVTCWRRTVTGIGTEIRTYKEKCPEYLKKNGSISINRTVKDVRNVRERG